MIAAQPSRASADSNSGTTSRTGTAGANPPVAAAGGSAEPASPASSSTARTSAADRVKLMT